MERHGQTGLLRVATVVGLQVRHGDKAHEPWKAPHVPLRTYLRLADSALVKFGGRAAEQSSSAEASTGGSNDGSTTGARAGMVLLASDNASQEPRSASRRVPSLACAMLR